ASRHTRGERLTPPGPAGRHWTSLQGPRYCGRMESIRDLARRVSNWGRWGADDERGTMNFVTPEGVRRAAVGVRRGVVFSLGLRLGADGPQIGQGGRVNPIHLMSAIDGRLGASPDAPRYSDDFVTMPLQCATQWDSLAHVFYDGQLYNGF